MISSTYRPMSAYERVLWQEIVHACSNRPGGVEFGPQSKAVILAVARMLEVLEAEEANVEAVMATDTSAFDGQVIWDTEGVRLLLTGGTDPYSIVIEDVAILLTKEDLAALRDAIPYSIVIEDVAILLTKEDLAALRDAISRHLGDTEAALLAEAERSEMLAGELERLSRELEEWQADRNVARAEADELQAECERLSREREAWQETARQNQRDADYYRNLVVMIGQQFGVAARTADDGTVMDDVLCAKVPELVSSELDKYADLRTEHEHLLADVQRLRSYPAEVIRRQTRPPLVIEEESDAK